MTSSKPCSSGEKRFQAHNFFRIRSLGVAHGRAAKVYQLLVCLYLPVLEDSRAEDP